MQSTAPSSAPITLSVIVPVHNVAAYLPKLLNSLQSQNLDDTEIIMIDDGSTDDSAKIIDGIQDDHFVIVHQNNQGVAAARNNALRRARGAYLCFIDPDDDISEKYLVSLRDAALRTHADVLVTDWWKKKEDGIERKELQQLVQHSPLTAERVLATILKSDVILGSLWAKAFASHLFGHNEFPVQRTCSDFVPCVTAIANAESVVYVPDVHYDYTAARMGSLQNSQTEEDIKDSVRVHQQFASLLRSRYPKLLQDSKLDMLGNRMQACIHVCRSSRIPTDKRKKVFYEYQRGLINHLPGIWHSSNSIKDKLLYTIISLGYYPAQCALKTRSFIARLSSSRR